MRTYTLVNGTNEDGSALVPAILDEVYNIPSGVSLVVPDGAELVMQGLAIRSETGRDEHGDPATLVTYSTTEMPPEQLAESTSETAVSCPTLNIADGARFIVDSGASFLINTIKKDMNTVLPAINISGLFETQADVVSAGVTVNSTGMLGGIGAFINSQIIINGGRTEALDLTVAGTDIYLNGTGADLNSLTVLEDPTVGEGEWAYKNGSLLVYTGNPTVGTLQLESGATLEVQTTSRPNDDSFIGTNDTVTVTGGLSGAGSVVMRSGVLTIDPEASVSRSNIVAPKVDDLFGITLGTVYDYTGTIKNAIASAWFSFPRTEPDTIAAASGAVPVIGLTIDGGYYTGGFAPGRFDGNVKSGNISSIGTFAGDTVSIAALKAAFGAEALSYTYDVLGSPTTKDKTVLLEMCVDGVYSYRLLEGDDSVPAANVERILCYFELFTPNGFGGSTITATSTDFTGTGILGGSGAGSVTGGTTRLAIAGRRQPTPDPDPDPDPAPDPDPDPAPDPDPDPDPAPAEKNAPAALRAETTALPETGDHTYLLSVYNAAGREITDLAGAKVRARMRFTLPDGWNKNSVFAVFRLPGGGLKAVKATVDPANGLLTFYTDTLGEFTLVSFEYTGTLYTPEFYDALEAYLAALA